MFVQTARQNKVSVEISQHILYHPHYFILLSSHWSKCGERVIKPLSFNDNYESTITWQTRQQNRPVRQYKRETIFHLNSRSHRLLFQSLILKTIRVENEICYCCSSPSGNRFGKEHPDHQCCWLWYDFKQLTCRNTKCRIQFF
jgi:hypothetical protein